MNIFRMLLAAMTGEQKVYRIELPIGNELSDGDRALIYGWPDEYVRGANENRRHDTRECGS